MTVLLIYIIQSNFIFCLTERTVNFVLYLEKSV